MKIPGGAMLDAFGSPTVSPRVSLTHRRNPRCRNCMPPAGVVPVKRGRFWEQEGAAEVVFENKENFSNPNCPEDLEKRQKGKTP